MGGKVGQPDGWITHAEDDRLRDLWPGAESYGADAGSGFLILALSAARIQCESFAPELDANAAVPDNYIAAQVLQARALVRAGVAGVGDQTGIEETVTVFPMDRAVKALLRPRRGKPYFGGSRS